MGEGAQSIKWPQKWCKHCSRLKVTKSLSTILCCDDHSCGEKKNSFSQRRISCKQKRNLTLYVFKRGNEAVNNAMSQNIDTPPTPHYNAIKERKSTGVSKLCQRARPFSFIPTATAGTRDFLGGKHHLGFIYSHLDESILATIFFF